jgi:hypothetical protein
MLHNDANMFKIHNIYMIMNSLYRADTESAKEQKIKELMN